MYSHGLIVGYSLIVLVLCANSVNCGGPKVNYVEALTKSLLFFEAQRSGVLPPGQRVKWRGDSALRDGQGDGVDLVGGYYDAGDNVKLNFPMAYTVTMLAWGVVEFEPKYIKNNELDNALSAIKWGTDYLLKCHSAPHVLYAGVGDGDADHACWERPEDMDTPRPAFKIDDSHPGSDLAAETAAAFAAASIAFKTNPQYSSTLIKHAIQLFEFADGCKGKYSDSVPSAHFYPSSGFEDELLWAATWLYEATKDNKYKSFIANSANTGGPRTMFSWDDKYVGAQLLASRLMLSGKEAAYRDQLEQFLCNCIQKGNNNEVMTPGGMVWFNEWATLQYSTSSMLAMTVYADHLAHAKSQMNCPTGKVEPHELIVFAKSQADYILGKNPNGMSYMVGYGPKYPVKIHHRGASIPSKKTLSNAVGCKEGFPKFYDTQSPNPNVLIGAVVGGPNRNDAYEDSRGNFQEAEPAIATVAPFVGVLARLS